MAEIADPDQNEALGTNEVDAIQRIEGIKRIGIDFEVLVEIDDDIPAARDVWEQVRLGARASANAIFERIAISAGQFAALLSVQNITAPDLFNWSPAWYVRWIRLRHDRAFIKIGEKAKGFKPDEPLIGQKIDGINLLIGTITLEPWKVLLIAEMLKVGMRKAPNRVIMAEADIGSLTLSSVGFEEGSRWARIKLRLEIIGICAMFLGPVLPDAATKGASPIMQTIFLHNRVQDQLARVPLIFREFRYSESELRKYGEDSFNYNEHGISAYERKQRMGLTELAAAVYSNSHLAIDGRIGPDATAILDDIARKNGLQKFDINDRTMRIALYKVLIPDGHLW